jgi:hypothetical protein
MSHQNQTLTIKQPVKQLPGIDKAGLARLRTQVLVRMKLRSQCCGGRIVAWHHDKFYCDTCDGWLNRPVKH